MGCGVSTLVSPEIHASKTEKEKAKVAIDAGALWRRNWLDFCDCLEQAQLAASHWAMDEKNTFFVDCFKTLAIQSTEVFIISKAFVLALEDHLSLLTDILSLHRDLHSNLKELDKARTNLNLLLKGKGAVQNTKQVPVKAKKSSTIIPIGDKSGDVTRSDEGLGSHVNIQTQFSEIIGYTERRGDPVYEARLRVDELTQMVDAKRSRCVWIKREKGPVSTYHLLKSMSDKWIRIGELFQSMQGILDLFAAEALKPSDSNRKSSLNFSHSSENHNQALLELSAILKHNEVSLRKRLKHMKKWITFQSDCSVLWEQVRDSQIRHVQATLDWWSQSSDSNNEDGKINYVEPGKALSDTSIDVSESIHLLALQTWLEGIKPSANPNMHNQNVRIEEMISSIQSSFTSFLPILKQLEQNEETVRLYYEEIQKVGREAAMVSMAQNKAASSHSTPQQQSGKVFALSIVKLDLARGKLEKLKAENEVFRVKTLIKAEFQLWESFTNFSKILGDSYEQVAKKIPIDANKSANITSLWITPIISSNNVISSRQQSLPIVEKSQFEESQNFSSSHTTADLLDMSVTEKEMLSIASSIKDVPKMTLNSQSSLNHQGQTAQEGSSTYSAVAAQSNSCLTVSGNNGEAIPTIFSRRKSVDVPKFVVEKPVEDIIGKSEPAQLEPLDAVTPLLPAKCGTGSLSELGTFRSLDSLKQTRTNAD